MVPFAKAHGLGNDFLLVAWESAGERDLPALAREICNRRTGVGADGLILWKPEGNRFRLRIINSDGSNAESSGNGLRCVAAYLFRTGDASGERVELETVSGVYRIEKHGKLFKADMGCPALVPADIPFVPAGSAPDRVVDYPIEVDGQTVRISACATGNPHCSVFVDDLDPLMIRILGPKLESHPAFPNRTNVEFVRIVNRGEIEVRFWERGAGPTPASGTGSCGAVVASVLNGKTDRKVVVHAENGDLIVEWTDDDRLSLVSSARVVAEGHFHDRVKDGANGSP